MAELIGVSLVVEPADQWSAVRRRLSHDWLKNTWLLRVGRLRRWAEGDLEPDAVRLAWVVETARMWERKALSFERLFAAFEPAMKPSQLLLDPAIRPADEALARQLAETMDAKWRGLVQPAELLRRSRDAARWCSRAAALLLQVCDRGDQLQPSEVKPIAIELDSAARALSAAISAYPAHVVVP